MWPTPTPIPTPAALPTFPVSAGDFTGTIASGVLQGWQMFDTSAFAAFVFFILLVLIVLMGIMSIRRHLERL
jgi:predicted lipid-binding transport protein (Tim44 family)